MGSCAGANELSYDLFLSYNSVDHSFVESVAKKLRDEGLEPFLDRWNLAPGMRWRSQLERTLSSCRAIAIFVGRGEMGSWQQRELDVALDLQSRNPSLPVIPILLPGCEPPLGFLSQLTWVDLRTQTNGQGIAILARAARGQAPGAEIQQHFEDVRVSICPYRGLLHFREEDAPFFFGREPAIDKLVDAVQCRPFVAVVGASGSGKSSVVRAGLVPRLRSDRRTVWETVILVPTAEPLKALAKALVPLLEPTMSEVDRLREGGKLANSLKSGEVSLYDIVERILEKQSGTDRVLIVVDQFEELYTLTSAEESRRRFLDELLAASSRAGSKANIVLTLRGDFVGKALAYRSMSDRLQDAQINLGPMTREELECSIRKPAEKIQLEFEPGLVRRILNDVGDEPGNLPLLEFVLKELWDKRCGRVLLNETYDAVGGLQGAVATKADELLNSLSPAEQKTLQRVFLRIVRPSESGLDTRRRASFAELPPEGAEIVVKLANERLLVTNQSASGLEQTVEVAHEALISNWGTLRAWVNEDREFLLWRERLGTLLTEWERVQESDDALLRGSLLIEAQKWFDQRSQDLSDQERKFISASRAAAEKRRQQQAAAAKSLRRLAWVMAAVAFVAVGGAIFGFWQKNEAENRKRDAEIANAEAKRQEVIAKENSNKESAARDQADGLINFMLHDLSDKLEPLGRLDVLNDVAEKAKGYLDTLPKEVVTVPRLRQQVVILNNLGNLSVAYGKLPEALDDYQKALAITKRLGHQDPSDVDVQRDLSVSYEKVGNILAEQDNLQEAFDAFQQSLNIRQTLAEQEQSDAGRQRDLSVGHEKVGDVLVAQGKLGEAFDVYQQSLNIRRTLAKRDQSDAGRQQDLSVGCEKIGEVLVRQGKLQEAFDVFQQSLNIRRTLAEQDQFDAGRQRDLSVAYQRIGNVLEMQGKLQEARDAYQQGLAITKRLADQDPSNAGWQRDLSLSYKKIGTFFEAQGKLQEALDVYQEDLAVAKNQANKDPSNAGWQYTLSLNYERVGGVFEAQDKLQEALEAYLQSLNIRQQLAKHDPSNIGWYQDFSENYDRVGNVLLTQSKLQEALAFYKRGLEIRQRRGWRLDLSMSYEKIGDVLVAQSKLQEALDAYQQSLKMRRTLAEEYKSKSDRQAQRSLVQRALIVCLYKVGTITAKMGAHDSVSQAQESLRAALNLADEYSGPDRQQLIDKVNRALENLLH